MACPHSSNCPLYPQFALQSLLSIWKTKFCDSNHAACERYKLSCAGRSVPLNLLPNGKTLEGAVQATDAGGCQ